VFLVNFGKFEREDEEESVGSCWVTLRKREGTVRCNKKRCITFSGHLALGEAVGS